MKQRGGIVKNIFKRKPSDFPTEYTVTNAFKKGDLFTKLSFLVLGLGNVVRKQVVKGALFLATEIAYIYYMIAYGFGSLKEFTTLGNYQKIETWSEEDGCYIYETVGRISVQVLLFAVFSEGRQAY